MWEDTPWTFNCLKYISNAYFLSDVTYHYRIRPNSIVTGTDSETKAINRFIGLHDVLTHLTPGHEREEAEHFFGSYFELFLCHFCHLPELKEDMEIYWHYAWANRNYKLCVALAFCYAFRRTKWLGRIVYSCTMRLTNPVLIPKDFTRIWRWIKR